MSQKVTPIAIQPVRAPRPRSAGGHGRAERTAPLTHFLPPYSKRRPGAGIHLKNRPKPQGGRGTPDRALQVVAGAPPVLLIDQQHKRRPRAGIHPLPRQAGASPFTLRGWKATRNECSSWTGSPDCIRAGVRLTLRIANGKRQSSSFHPNALLEEPAPSGPRRIPRPRERSSLHLKQSQRTRLPRCVG